MKLVLLIIPQIFLLFACSNSQIITDRNGQKVEVNCQPVYGRWCGRGYPAYEVTGWMPRPVDQWDNACKNHDLCYDIEGKDGEDYCDRVFSRELEDIRNSGTPVPRAIINAYNIFKEDLQFRSLNVSLSDILDATTLSCTGEEGKAALFCDIGAGPYNCEISQGNAQRNAPCFCDMPFVPQLRLQQGRYFGEQKTANSF